ncbi:MAG: hypothetical protein KZQ70_15540 [gamma proteobacterium symbiont of Lucinoma myriamae]|nr:hypothetical protein [gamma proteobacterium symbiont of Lucinoma myriamae]
MNESYLHCAFQDYILCAGILAGSSEGAQSINRELISDSVYMNENLVKNFIGHDTIIC